MARKPTRIARRGIARTSIAICTLVAAPALAQDAPRTTVAAPIVQNPFATGGGTSVAAAPVAEQPAERASTVYRNPFNSASTSPPLDFPLRPGPVSRWQRTAEGTKQPSAVTSAILTIVPNPNSSNLRIDPVGRAALDWDHLPPIDDMFALRAVRSTATAAHPGVPLASPPDPVQFAHNPLVQPAWMEPDFSGAHALSVANEVSTPALIDPFDVQDAEQIAIPPRREHVGNSLGNSFSTEIIGQSAAVKSVPLRSLGPTPKSVTGSMVDAATNDEALSVVVSDFVVSPDDWYAQADRKAREAGTLNDFSAVAELCQHGIEMNPTPEVAVSLRRLAAWAHNRCGESQIDAGQPAKALAEFQSAIGLDPLCSLAIHNRGVTLAQQNKASEALRDFDRVVELNPGLAIAYRNRAELLASLGRMDEAVRDYDRALEQASDDAELFRARGYAWQRLGDFDRALDDLNQAIRLAPTDAVAYTQRGNLAAERSDFEQAIHDFQRAMQIEPRSGEAYRGLAWLFATCPNPRFRDAKQSLALAQKGASLSQSPDCFMLDALAAAHASAGEYREAVGAAQQAIAAAPADFALPIRERLALYQQGKPYVNQPNKRAVQTASHEEPVHGPSK